MITLGLLNPLHLYCWSCSYSTTLRIDSNSRIQNFQMSNCLKVQKHFHFSGYSSYQSHYFLLLQKRILQNQNCYFRNQVSILQGRRVQMCKRFLCCKFLMEKTYKVASSFRTCARNAPFEKQKKASRRFKLNFKMRIQVEEVDWKERTMSLHRALSFPRPLISRFGSVNSSFRWNSFNPPISPRISGRFDFPSSIIITVTIRRVSSFFIFDQA